MKADVFYQDKSSTACLLKLVSLSQWKAQAFSAEELGCAAAHGFEGKIGDIVYFHDNSGAINRVLVGSGQNELDHAIAWVATKLPAGAYEVEQDLSDRALLMWSLAQYRYERYKKNVLKPRRLCLEERARECILKQARAIFLVRDLINTPAQEMGPAELAQAAESLAIEFNAKFEVIEGEALKEGYPAIYTVGRAAGEAPRLISLTWGKTTHPRVTLLGKGVCFDTGGLNIKNAAGMRIMKKDMGGAAHALGLAQWIMAQALPIQLQVFIPAVENAISGNAYRPGDVIRMRNDLTVEIENTDAEGRLVLADALVKACEDKPQLLIDFSTLTGAARIAVGSEISAFFTNDEKLASDLNESSHEENDPLWRLPLHPAYQSMLDSSVADLMNSSSSSYAGAITAALFLQRFVSPDVSWVHFDMMAWNVSNKPGKPEGGEAMALRAVANYLQRRFS